MRLAVMLIGLNSPKENKLKYTWNGLNPEIIRDNWRPGDEYWVIVWWKNFYAQSVYYPHDILEHKAQSKGKTMNTNVSNTDLELAHEELLAVKLDKDGNPILTEGDEEFVQEAKDVTVH